MWWRSIVGEDVALRCSPQALRPRPNLRLDPGQAGPSGSSGGRGRAGGMTGAVELGGIEPPSAERLPIALRPFPRTTACRLPHRRVGWPEGLRRVFPRCQRSFLAVSGLSRRQPSLLLPGCGGQALRALTGRGCSRCAWRSGGEGVLLIGSCVCAPFRESEQLRSHNVTSGLDVETDQPRVMSARRAGRPLVKQRVEHTGIGCQPGPCAASLAGDGRESGGRAPCGGGGALSVPARPSPRVETTSAAVQTGAGVEGAFP